MEVDADEEQVKVSGALETQEVALQMHSVLHEEKDNQQIGSVDYHTNSGSVDKMTASKEEDKQTGKGEDSMDELKSDGGNGGMTREENEDHDQEMTSKGNTMADQLDGSEAAEDSVVGPHQMVPTFGQNDEKRTKTLPSSSTDSQLPNEDPDFGMECNRQLVEENAKLKKLLEKLLEAGKEQLNGISSLSGRVKHVEKMLSRSDKKARRRRHWRTFSAASCAKPSKESTRKKAIDVAS